MPVLSWRPSQPLVLGAIRPIIFRSSARAAQATAWLRLIRRGMVKDKAKLRGQTDEAGPASLLSLAGVRVI